MMMHIFLQRPERKWADWQENNIEGIDMSGITNLEDLGKFYKENYVPKTEESSEEEDILEVQAEGEDQDSEKVYKTMATTSLVTVVAYLIGMDEDNIRKFYGEHNSDLIEDLQNNKQATIIRYLCRLRTSLMLNFKKTDNEMLYNLGNIDRMDWFHKDEINKLRKLGIETVQTNSRADKYSELFCQLIADHIDDCKLLFPDWINYDYYLNSYIFL